jgi:hypothetical protein
VETTGARVSQQKMSVNEARELLNQHRLEAARVMIAEQRDGSERAACGVYTPDPRYSAIGPEYRVPCSCGAPSCLPK